MVCWKTLSFGARNPGGRGGERAGGGGQGGVVVDGGGERGRGRLFWSETFQSLFGAQSRNFLQHTTRYELVMLFYNVLFVYVHFDLVWHF
jgi:hypothetical protein